MGKDHAYNIWLLLLHLGTTTAPNNIQKRRTVRACACGGALTVITVVKDEAWHGMAAWQDGAAWPSWLTKNDACQSIN